MFHRKQEKLLRVPHHSGRLSSSRKFFLNGTFFSPSVSITRWLNGPATQRRQAYHTDSIRRNIARCKRCDQPGTTQCKRSVLGGLRI